MGCGAAMVAVRNGEQRGLVDEGDGEDDSQPAHEQSNFYASPLRRAKSIVLFASLWHNPNLSLTPLLVSSKFSS